MGRYFYPSASDALSAKKMFLREHGYKIPHCFQNTWGTGYVLFDSKTDVNNWYKEHTGEAFYKEEYEPGTIFTKNDALREIEQSYGSQIDEVLRYRDPSMPVLAMGLPSSFGNQMFLQFVKSSDEKDIAYLFYIHYDPFIFDSAYSVPNRTLREQIVAIIYKVFYNSRFKKRIEGSNQELARREAERKAAEAERARIERERRLEQQRKDEDARRKQHERQAAIERERKYQEALVKYKVELSRYESEMKIYCEAMSLKKRFTYGGQFPNGAWFICFLLLLVLIFSIMLLGKYLEIFPQPLIFFSAVAYLAIGNHLIFKKLKSYIAEPHFDENGFLQWIRQNPNSPLIKYVRNSLPPAKPMQPSR